MGLVDWHKPFKSSIWTYVLVIAISIFSFLEISQAQTTPGLVLRGRGARRGRRFDLEDSDDGAIWQVMPRLDNRALTRDNEFLQRRRKKCSTRIQIENGKRRILEQGSLVRFRCSFGYFLLGSSVAACVRGQWSEPPPVCIRGGCLRPEVPAGMIGRPLFAGAAIMFDCLPGFQMRGQSMIVCNGIRWNGTLPTCHRTDPLPRPSVPMTTMVYESGDDVITEASEDHTGLPYSSPEPEETPVTGAAGFTGTTEHEFEEESEDRTTFFPETSHQSTLSGSAEKSTAHPIEVTEINKYVPPTKESSAARDSSTARASFHANESSTARESFHANESSTGKESFHANENSTAKESFRVKESSTEKASPVHVTRPTTNVLTGAVTLATNLAETIGTDAAIPGPTEVPRTPIRQVTMETIDSVEKTTQLYLNLSTVASKEYSHSSPIKTTKMASTTASLPTDTTPNVFLPKRPRPSTQDQLRCYYFYRNQPQKMKECIHVILGSYGQTTSTRMKLTPAVWPNRMNWVRNISGITTTPKIITFADITKTTTELPSMIDLMTMATSTTEKEVATTIDSHKSTFTTDRGITSSGQAKYLGYHKESFASTDIASTAAHPREEFDNTLEQILTNVRAKVTSNNSHHEFITPFKLDNAPGGSLHVSKKSNMFATLSVISTIGIFAFVGVVFYYCWTRNKGIARRSRHDSDGRHLSVHLDMDEEFVYFGNK